MKTTRRWVAGLAAALTITLLLPEAGLAYGGPGSVISGIGALLAAIAAIGAAIFGFFWFPLKRLYQKLRGEENEDEDVEREVAEAS